jgi:hypothetical protein
MATLCFLNHKTNKGSEEQIMVPLLSFPPVLLVTCDLCIISAMEDILMSNSMTYLLLL